MKKTSSALRFPSASAFFSPLIHVLGHHSSSVLTFEDDKLIGDHSFPPEFIQSLESRSQARAGTIKSRNGGKVKVVHLKVAQPYVPIAKTDSLCRQVLVIGGLLEMVGTKSITQLPKDWRLDAAKPKGGQHGLYRVIGFAFRNQRLGYNNCREERTWQPLTWRKGMEPQDPRLVVHGDFTHVDPDYARHLILSGDHLYKSLRPISGVWMLTTVGAMAAQNILDEKGVPGYSRTAQWIDANIGPKELEKLYMNLARRLPRSATLLKIQGHVHNKLLKLIELDSFANLLEQGKTPTLSQVAHFCFRSAVSDLVSDGRNPACRALHGAVTPRELAGETLVKDSEQTGGPIWMTSDEDCHNGPIVDVVDDSLEAVIMERDALRNGLADVEQAIRAFKPRAGERYVDVFRSQVDGITIRELGAKEGVGYDRASTLINETRNVARASALCGQLSLKALEAILEEPGSTIDNLWDDIDGGSIKVPGVPAHNQETAGKNLLNTAVNFLVRTNRIEMDGQSYRAVPGAHLWLEQHQSNPDPLFFAH